LIAKSYLLRFVAHLMTPQVNPVTTFQRAAPLIGLAAIPPSRGLMKKGRLKGGLKFSTFGVERSDEDPVPVRH